jgi:predicted nuclease with TOPRIM domain
MTTTQQELADLYHRLEELKADYEILNVKVDGFELDVDDYHDEYSAMLDEETVTVCGMKFYPSQILRELDPTAYRCGLLDYVDSLDKWEHPDYCEMAEELEELESSMEEIEDEISELEE